MTKITLSDKEIDLLFRAIELAFIDLESQEKLMNIYSFSNGVMDAFRKRVKDSRQTYEELKEKIKNAQSNT